MRFAAAVGRNIDTIRQSIFIPMNSQQEKKNFCVIDLKHHGKHMYRMIVKLYLIAIIMQRNGRGKFHLHKNGLVGGKLL